jgi:hypothetical protein
MNILKDVLLELFGMFVADARLTLAILAIVAIAALLIDATSLPALLGGVALLVGCVVILVLSVLQAAARHKSGRE